MSQPDEPGPASESRALPGRERAAAAGGARRPVAPTGGPLAPPLLLRWDRESAEKQARRPAGGAIKVGKGPGRVWGERGRRRPFSALQRTPSLRNLPPRGSPGATLFRPPSPKGSPISAGASASPALLDAPRQHFFFSPPTLQKTNTHDRRGGGNPKRAAKSDWQKRLPSPRARRSQASRLPG